MARVPRGIELPRRGGQFENRQKTCCSESPRRISPCFACLIKIRLIKVAARSAIQVVACECVQITARGFVQIAPCEFIQGVAYEVVQVATRGFTSTSRREIVESAQWQAQRTANNRPGSPR
jgi:hypothetical protein